MPQGYGYSTVHRPYYLSAASFERRYEDLILKYTETDQGTEPLTLSEAQDHLGITDSRFDAQITSLIAEARGLCEKRVYRTIRANVVRQVTAEKFPRNRVIELLRPPLISVDLVNWLDDDGTPTAVDPTDYRVVTSDLTAGLLEFNQGFDTPPYGNRLDAVIITYTSGYADVASIPRDLVAAIKLQMDLLWDHDESPAVMKHYREVRDELLENYDPGAYKT